jgi:hypothetical protein
MKNTKENSFFSNMPSLTFVSHFPTKAIQNGLAGTYIKEIKDMNWSQCYIVCTFSVHAVHFDTIRDT